MLIWFKIPAVMIQHIRFDWGWGRSDGFTHTPKEDAQDSTTFVGDSSVPQAQRQSQAQSPNQNQALNQPVNPVQNPLVKAFMERVNPLLLSMTAIL